MKVDRLSSLPEEIISNILSLMPTKFAVQTSVLSKRWRYIWTFITNLDINDDYHLNVGSNSFLKIVDRVLKLCKTSQLKLFRLGLSHLSVPKSEVSKWINEAIRLNVSELDLQLKPIRLPLNLFTCKTLTDLKMNVQSIYDQDVFVDVPSSVLLPGLKTLDLRVYLKPSVNIFRFIHGCPVLENLSLEINWPNNEQHYNFNIHTLKRLELRTRSFVISDEVVLNVPNLEYLILGGSSCPHFVMEDVSSLVKATVSLSYYNRKTEIFKGLSGVKSLSWSSSTFNDLINSPMPKFLNLKHLELKDTSRSPLLPVLKILENTYELEHLCIEEINLCLWVEPQPVPTCMLLYLRTVKFTKFKGNNCNIKILEYVLAKAEVLKTLTIICGSLCMKEERAMYARMLKFPRASRFCKIHFVGKWLISTDN